MYSIDVFSTVSTYRNPLQSPVIQKDKELIFTLDKIQEESFICILFQKNLKKSKYKVPKQCSEGRGRGSLLMQLVDYRSHILVVRERLGQL